MMPRHGVLIIFLGLTLTATACTPRQFYWGTYEDTLYTREQQAGATGENEAATTLAAIIDEASAAGDLKVAPGIHADYGYLLFKQGKPDEAIAQLQQEATLYPESKVLMEKMVSRIQGLKDQRKEKKPTP